MTISEAQSVLHCPDAYGGIYGKKYGEALGVAFECMSVCESAGSCNTCKNKRCECEPKLGQMVRYNCPFYKGRVKNDT